MPIAAVPNGVDIRKLTPTQKRALDELLKKQQEENILQTAIKVAVPTVAFVGVSAFAIASTFAYLKDLELPTVKDVVTGAGDLVSDTILTGVEAIAGKQEPLTPEFTPSGAGPIPRCQRWESDYVDIMTKVNAGEAEGFFGTVTGALLLKNVIKNMKREGCERPLTIPESQWNEA